MKDKNNVEIKKGDIVAEGKVGELVWDEAIIYERPLAIYDGKLKQIKPGIVREGGYWKEINLSTYDGEFDGEKEDLEIVGKI